MTFAEWQKHYGDVIALSILDPTHSDYSISGMAISH